MATKPQIQSIPSSSNDLPTVAFTTKRRRSRAVQQAFLQSHGLEPHEWPTANSKLADVVIRIRAKLSYQTQVRQARHWKQELGEVKQTMESLKNLTRQELLREFKQSYEEASNLAVTERDAVTEINQMSRYLYNNVSNLPCDAERQQLTAKAPLVNSTKGTLPALSFQTAVAHAP